MAFDKTLPEYKIDIRTAISFFVYQLEIKNNAPGKKALSTTPKKKRTVEKGRRREE